MTFAGTLKTVKDGGKRRAYIVFGLQPDSANFRWDKCMQFNNFQIVSVTSNSTYKSSCWIKLGTISPG